MKRGIREEIKKRRHEIEREGARELQGYQYRECVGMGVEEGCYEEKSIFYLQG